jgi:hypothetical protein
MDVRTSRRCEGTCPQSDQAASHRRRRHPGHQHHRGVGVSGVVGRPMAHGQGAAALAPSSCAGRRAPRTRVGRGVGRGRRARRDLGVPALAARPPAPGDSPALWPGHAGGRNAPLHTARRVGLVCCPADRSSLCSVIAAGSSQARAMLVLQQNRCVADAQAAVRQISIKSRLTIFALALGLARLGVLSLRLESRTPRSPAPAPKASRARRQCRNRLIRRSWPGPVWDQSRCRDCSPEGSWIARRAGPSRRAGQRGCRVARYRRGRRSRRLRRSARS